VGLHAQGIKIRPGKWGMSFPGNLTCTREIFRTNTISFLIFK